ncbi:MAG: ABC transporter ATP-binding protein [Roseiarcus sp.]
MAGRSLETPCIELANVSKSFGATRVLRDLSLQALRGEFVALLGPSGCGKSTILRIIAGIEACDEGEIAIDGQVVNYLRPSARNVAMVFQSYALYPHMTVGENIAFPLTTSHGRGADRATVAVRVAEAAQLVDLTDKLERLPSQLSGGQRQRVALARSIVRHPVAFLMDEPLSNLDALLRHEMRHSLIDLHRRVGRTTLYVTHDQFEAMTMADRIVVMNHGRIQQVGSPREVFERPANRFVAGFVGSPAMNMLSGRIERGRFVSAHRFSIDLPVSAFRIDEGASVSLGLRPTDLSIGPLREAEAAVIGRVARIEYGGADIFVDLALAGPERVRLRASTEATLADGERVEARIPLRALHLFAADGRSLRMRTGEAA